jgi:pilus assembly protein CpaE
MAQTIRASVAVDGGVSGDAIRVALSEEPGIALSAFVPATPDSVSHLADVAHEALIVACGGDSPQVLQFINGAVSARPERPIVVVYQGSANGFVREAFDAGAADLVTGELAIDGIGDAKLGRDIAFALEKAMARHVGQAVQSAPAGPAVGEMITVLGPKGGTGKTLTSCNLAAALATAGASVVIVDLDLQFGDVGLALGLRPERTLYDLATAGGTMDVEKIEDFLMVHPSGVRALLAPRRPDHAGAVTVEFTRNLFDTLRQMADYVIVDTPPGFTPEVIAAIDRSSSVCLVAMLDALSLKNTKLALETLDLMEYDRSKVKIVLNRADSRVGVTADDVTTLLGQAPDVRIPSHRDITRSVNEATPIVLTGSNAETKRAFQWLAASYGKADQPAPSLKKAPKRRRRFGRGRKAGN